MSTDRTVNPWQKFKNLLPGGARTVVTITANNGDGTSNAALRDSTAILVKGETVAPGNKALVVDGEVRQQVPSLPQTAVEV
jgi:hypothetical protein